MLPFTSAQYQKSMRTIFIIGCVRIPAYRQIFIGLSSIMNPSSQRWAFTCLQGAGNSSLDTTEEEKKPQQAKNEFLWNKGGWRLRKKKKFLKSHGHRKKKNSGASNFSCFATCTHANYCQINFPYFSRHSESRAGAHLPPALHSPSPSLLPPPN